MGVELRELPGQPLQHRPGHRPDRPEQMVPGHPLFRGEVADRTHLIRVYQPMWREGESLSVVRWTQHPASV